MLIVLVVIFLASKKVAYFRATIEEGSGIWPESCTHAHKYSVGVAQIAKLVTKSHDTSAVASCIQCSMADKEDGESRVLKW